MPVLLKRLSRSLAPLQRLQLAPHLLHPAQALHVWHWMEKQTMLHAAEEHFCLKYPYHEKSWIAASIQPLPTVLKTLHCFMELEQTQPGSPAL